MMGDLSYENAEVVAPLAKQGVTLISTARVSLAEVFHPWVHWERGQVGI